MNWLPWIIIIILISLFLMNQKKGASSKQETAKPVINNTTEDQSEAEEPETNKRRDYSNCYQAKYLLTKNEWYEYKKLKQVAAAHDLQVLPKVRMLDIIEPRKGEKDYKILLAKIKSKHIDFLICDQDARIKGVVELDDNSHNRGDRQNRDNFVDEILTSVGYKVIHTRSITETTLEPITGAKTE